LTGYKYLSRFGAREGGRDTYRLFKFLHLAAVTLNALYLALLLSVVGAMALKPSF
jgi:hypothetical protein